ncbi:hypothetical protein GZ78_11250 [Endozoicomonas numazuensis]|uniref:Uncharacterized protein n=1 Tax=Endozoicomonas numazuensis TaxID=1137799 RepID=A0A081NI58_9GAMM|nr:hypothetical protein GZ78_11250 [Endozoicomonas numazuensis]
MSLIKSGAGEYLILLQQFAHGNLQKAESVLGLDYSYENDCLMLPKITLAHLSRPAPKTHRRLSGKWSEV